MFKPSIAEAHARGMAAGQLGSGASVGRVLEQRHPRLLPKPMTKQKRGINCCREHRSRNRLGHVVPRSKLCRACLKMYLETCVARFHHDVVVRDLEFVQTFDMN